MRDYSLSVLFFEDRDSLMLFTQANYFYLGRNTRSEQVCMYWNRHVLNSTRRTTAASLWSDWGSSRVSIDEVWSGRNTVCITINVKFWASSTQIDSSTARVNISSMNTPIGYSFASTSTASVSDCNIRYKVGR